MKNNWIGVVLVFCVGFSADRIWSRLMNTSNKGVSVSNSSAENLAAESDSANITPLQFIKSPPLIKSPPRTHSGFELSPTLFTYNKDSMKQSLTWGGTDSTGHSLTIRNFDKVTSVEREFNYSSAFEITAVAYSSKDIFYVVTASGSGIQTIEKWRHIPKKYQPINGPTAYRIKRSGIYSGTVLGDIDQISADPYDRFLLIAHYDPDLKISQMELGPGNLVTTHLGPNEAYLLRDQVWGLSRAEHYLEGLIWTVWLNPEVPGDSGVILRDLNNDGILDNWTSYDYTQMSVNYTNFTSDFPWVDNFYSFPSAD